MLWHAMSCFREQLQRLVADKVAPLRQAQLQSARQRGRAAAPLQREVSEVTQRLAAQRMDAAAAAYALQVRKGGGGRESEGSFQPAGTP